MAVPENIRVAAAALEDQCAAALCIAQCFMEAAGHDQGLNEPAWISQYSRQVHQLTAAAEQLVAAINGSDL